MTLTTGESSDVTWAPEAQRTVNEAPQQDYFGFSRTLKYFLPDKVSYIEFKPMNEGHKKAFQDKTSRDLVLERNSGNARMSVLQGTERHELIRASVVDWNLTRGGSPVPLTKTTLNDFLDLADPVVVEGLEREIRKANPWLLQDMSVADIDKEIENLQEMRKTAVEREAGEAS
jgi:hypothetical protein